MIISRKNVLLLYDSQLMCFTEKLLLLCIFVRGYYRVFKQSVGVLRPKLSLYVKINNKIQTRRTLIISLSPPNPIYVWNLVHYHHWDLFRLLIPQLTVTLRLPRPSFSGAGPDAAAHRVPLDTQLIPTVLNKLIKCPGLRYESVKLKTYNMPAIHFLNIFRVSASYIANIFLSCSETSYFKNTMLELMIFFLPRHDYFHKTSIGKFYSNFLLKNPQCSIDFIDLLGP